MGKNKNKNKEIPLNEKLLFDDRISSKMIELYNNACLNFKKELVDDPIYILDNIEKCKLNYINYNNQLLKSLQDNKINYDEFKEIINSSYSEYMNLILNINIYK